MVHQVVAGQTYVLTVTAGFSSTYFDVWIDFNDDLVLNNADELILNDGVCSSVNTRYTFNITIPDDAPGGTHIMRFRTNWASPVTDPCATYSYGNCCDFKIQIGGGIPTDWLSAPVLSGSVAAGQSSHIEVVFNSNGLPDPSVKSGNLIFATNAPGSPHNVLTKLNVGLGTGTILSVNPSELIENHATPNTITLKTLNVQNTGTTPVSFNIDVQRFPVVGPDVELDPEWVAEQYAQRAALEGDPFSERHISTSRGGFMDNILEDFDLQFEYPVGVGGGEAGIEADANYIYTSKWNGTDFYRYDYDGTYVGSFAIPGAGQIRDLAYDGTYFYGGQGSSTVYIMDFVGQTLIGQFSAPTAVRAIAWDDGEEGLWANNWSTTITLFDLQGAVLGTIPTAGDESFYGFAYDHQGPYLWGYGQSGPNNNQLYKYALPGGSLELTHDVFPMLSLVASGDIAGGLAFQPDIVTGFNTLLGLVQNVCLWGIEMGNTTIFDIDVGVSSIVSPNSGVNLGSSEPVVIKIKNHGTNSVSNIPWSVNMTGQGSASFNGTYSGSLASGADVEISVGTVNLSAYGTYNFEACTNLSGDQNPNNDCKTKPVTNKEPSLCVDNLYSTGCTYGDGLISWDFANINVPNIPCSGTPPWYHDYRDMVHQVVAGQTYVLTVTAGFSSTYFDVWIDLNDDLVLNNADELILNDGLCATANTPYTFNITIPADAPGGAHVIRYRTNWSQPVTDPCATYYYGNAVDFKIFINSWISLAPSVGSLNVGESMDVFVTFNSTGLDYDIYNANILINANDSITQPFTVPVELSVGALTPPLPATLVSPDNNATLVPLQPTFTWIANTSAFNKLVITTGTPPFTNTVYESPWFVGDSFDLATTGFTLEKKKNYNWHVNTKNSAGLVSSPIWKFETIGSGIFKGLITDSYSGLPLEGVGVITDPGNYVVFTDNTGNYTIEDLLEGDYILTANKDGYNSAEQSGSITHNATTYVNFELDMFLAPPFGLHADIENIFDVHLTWSEAAKGSITLTPVVEAPVTSNFGGTLTLNSNGLTDPVISFPTVTRSTPVLLGYNVYRDNTFLALVTDSEYYDFDLSAGTYSYEVTAVYDQGESEPTYPVSVSILTPPTLLIAEQQGPEVFLQWQSNFVGKGVLADGSNKAKAFLDSYTGNTLTEDMQLRLFGGSYQSNQVHSGIRCELECPAGAINESELCGQDLNGGCNSDPEVFESIAIGDVICGTAWAVEGTRDTDWYELIVTEPKTVTWTVTAEFPVYAFIIDGNNGCDGLEIISVGQADPCDTAVAAAVVTPGIYWLWVANQEFEDYPCGESDNYVAELTAEDIFLPYFKLYRNDVVIGEIYDLYHFDDAIAPGNDYCYSVSEVVSDEGIETAKSNELCVNIPVYGSLAVTPGSLNETHSTPPQVTTKTLTVSNTGAGPIEFDVAIVLFGKDNRASLARPVIEIDPEWVAEQYAMRQAAEGAILSLGKTVPGGASPNMTDDEIIRWDDGVNADAIGLVNGGTFYVAAYFPVSTMGQYSGMKLNQVEIFVYDVPTSMVLRINGQGTATSPGPLLHSQPLTNLTSMTWHMVDLTDPVDITGEDLWIGYEVTHDQGVYAAGCDGGPAVAGFGDMISMDGTTYQSMATYYGFNYNWNIAGYLIQGTTFAKDVGVQIISEPNTGVNLTGAEVVKFTIKNYGTDAQSNIPWTVTMTGQGSASLNGTYAGPLAAGATAEITAGTANLSAYGIYNFEACTNLAGDEYPNNDCKTKAVKNNEPSICWDNLYSSGCSFGDGLTSWDFANINVPNIPCSGTPPWYHDYRDMVHQVVAGQTYVLTVTAGFSSTYFDVWIDFNDDFVLNNADELVLNDGLCATANTTYTFNITIPADAPGGAHVIRYRTNWSQPVTDPCATYSYGNAVDFKIFINSWITVSPSVGSLNVGESMDVVVTFNSSNIDYGVHKADILFVSNNPFITQPEAIVPAQLTVGKYSSQDILMPLGWSGWSAYIYTMGASFENVVAPVVNDMVITQHFTEIFWPQYGINAMGNFTNDHGYISKMSADATLSLEGMMAVPTVALNAGWNLFPILVDCNLDAAEVFGGITGFIIGYEVAGNGVYYPAGSIATLTTLVPGNAYWVKVLGAANYTFPECVRGAKASYIAPLRHANTTPWNEPTYTGSSHIVVFNADASVSFAKGDMIGAFTNDGACAGLTLCDGKAVSLALFADDITTSVKDGFVQGESLTFKLYRQSNDTEYNLIVNYSSQAPNYDGLFEPNGLSVINNVTMYATGIGSQDLTSLTVYPNPSQGLFNVSVDNHSQDVNWVVTDAKGRYVMEGRLADSHQIDLRTQPKGVYFIKFTGDNVLHIEKLVVR
jgi:hypothetical protein